MITCNFRGLPRKLHFTVAPVITENNRPNLVLDLFLWLWPLRPVACAQLRWSEKQRCLHACQASVVSNCNPGCGSSEWGRVRLYPAQSQLQTPLLLESLLSCFLPWDWTQGSTHLPALGSTLCAGSVSQDGPSYRDRVPGPDLPPRGAIIMSSGVEVTLSAWRVWGVSREDQILPPGLLTLIHAWRLVTTPGNYWEGPQGQLSRGQGEFCVFPVGEPKFRVKVITGGGTLTVHQGSLHCFLLAIFLHRLTFPDCSEVFSLIIRMWFGGWAFSSV